MIAIKQKDQREQYKKLENSGIVNLVKVNYNLSHKMVILQGGLKEKNIGIERAMIWFGCEQNCLPYMSDPEGKIKGGFLIYPKDGWILYSPNATPLNQMKNIAIKSSDVTEYITCISIDKVLRSFENDSFQLLKTDHLMDYNTGKIRPTGWHTDSEEIIMQNLRRTSF